MSSKKLLLGVQIEGLAKAAPADGAAPSGATAAHLARINAMPGVLRELSAADLYVRSMLCLNSRVLYNGFLFPEEELANVAMLARSPGGIPVECNHDTYNGRAALPVGTVFGGGLTRIDDVVHVEMPFYMLKGTVGDELVSMIDGGVIREQSVQIGFDRLECSVCGSDMDYGHQHRLLENYNGVICHGLVRGVSDLYEVSLVWAGMAKDTRFRMAAAAQMVGVRNVMELLQEQDELASLYEDGAAWVDRMLQT